MSAEGEGGTATEGEGTAVVEEGAAAAEEQGVVVAVGCDWIGQEKPVVDGG